MGVVWLYVTSCFKPIPVAARSKMWVCGRSLAGFAVSNPTGGMDVCVLSGRGLCVGLITRPQESYRECGVPEYHREA